MDNDASLTREPSGEAAPSPPPPDFFLRKIFFNAKELRAGWRLLIFVGVMTALFFVVGKWALGLYLGSGKAGAAYGAASSLITLLLWIYYSSQILLFGAEFTQVFANRAGRGVSPDRHAIRIETKEVEKSARGK